MRRGMPSGTRHFQPPVGDALAIDPGEQTAREAASARMLEALMREHPERATASHPDGTQAPRRVPTPTGVTVQAIDYEG